MDVGEVAFAVGYAGPSRFAAAFEKRYGIRPSSLPPHGNGSLRPLAPDHSRNHTEKEAAM